MMKRENRRAPPMAIAVSVISFPMKICRNPPRIRTINPVERAAPMLEKSLLVLSRCNV